MDTFDFKVGGPAKIRDYSLVLHTLAEQTNLQVGHFGGSMPVNQLAVFFEVASAQALGSYATTTDIRIKLAMDRRAVSRYLMALGQQGYGGVKGMQLIEFIEGATDKRVKRIALTPKGEELALRLAHHLQDDTIRNMPHIKQFVDREVSDSTFMLGVDCKVGINVFVVRKAYRHGLYAAMRQRMFSDIADYNFENFDLIVLERPLTLTNSEINQTLDNLSQLQKSKPSRIYVWLASDENPGELADRLGRHAVRRQVDNTISFHNKFEDIANHLNLPDGWALPELFPYN